MNTKNNWIVFPETAWSPASEIRREFDRLFDEWGSPVSRGLRTESGFIPACDVEEGDDHFLLTLEVAGIKKEDIKLELSDGQLTVSGERRSENKPQPDAHWYSERRYGRFQRNFTLPAGTDATRVEANYQDGVLRILLPKAEAAKPRQIKITSGSNGLLGKFLGQVKSKNDSPQEPHREAETMAS